MNKYLGEGLGKVMILNLKRGDLLLETIEEELEKSAVLDHKAHFHMVISDEEKAYSGHLEPGTTVLYLSEITLVEIKGVALHRVKNENNIGMICEMGNK